MKRRYAKKYLLALIVVFSTSICAETFEDGNYHEAKPLKVMAFATGLNRSDIYRMDVANLEFKNSHGKYETAYDLYVTAYRRDGSPILVDHIDGAVNPELTTLDLDLDGNEEVLLHYNIGGHSGGYRIYEITFDGNTKIEAVDSSELVSSLDSIKISLNSERHRYEFQVEDRTAVPWSEASPPHTKSIFTTTNLAFAKGKLVVISSSSRTVDD